MLSRHGAPRYSLRAADRPSENTACMVRATVHVRISPSACIVEQWRDGSFHLPTHLKTLTRNKD